MSSVSMTMTTMWMSMASPMFVKQAKAHKIDKKAEGPHYQNFVRIMNVFWFIESFETFHTDGKAKGYEEHGIDKCTWKKKEKKLERIFMHKNFFFAGPRKMAFKQWQE